MVAVLCIAAALLGCGKKNVGTPEDNAVVEEDDKKNDDTKDEINSDNEDQEITTEEKELKNS